VFPKFVDEVEILISGGRGGKGAVSFFRKKYQPVGPPDGGDGGKGGNVFFVMDPQISNLNHFNPSKIYAAKNGKHGEGNRKHGKDGEDLIIRVPPGTIIEDAKTNERIYYFDFENPVNKPVLVAKGGMGGKGNEFYKSSVLRSPKIAQKGLPGEKRLIRLRLELIADAGLIGLPNAGKSTLLSKLTPAKPKIADYPFTTVSPYLGILEDDYKKIKIADIPGLIENAHKGAGLGLSFLRHIKKTKVLIFVLDASSSELQENYELLCKELEYYDKELLEKEFIVVFNKMDLVKDKNKVLNSLIIPENIKKVFVSGLTGEGISDLKNTIVEIFNR